MRALISLIFLYILNLSIAQEAWTLTVSTPRIERIFDIRKTSEGSYIACGNRQSMEENLYYSFLVKFSDDGQLLQDQDFLHPDSASTFASILDVSDSSFVVLGEIGPDDQNMTELWIIHFNYDFEIIRQFKLLCFPDRSYVEPRPKFISNGNLLIHGFVQDSLEYTDLYFYETNLEGDSISAVMIDLPNHQFSEDFIERKNGQGYYSYCFGAFPDDPPGLDFKVLFDTNYNYISVDSVPRRIRGLMNSKWLSQSSYLLTGKKYYFTPNTGWVNMGIIKLDTSDQIMNENYFGLQADTNTYPGSIDNIDFIDPDTIFYSGTGNFVSYPWQFKPSWIIVNCLDSNLNLRWQSFYGGDAFYHSWDVYATSDGGCLVSTHRFDYASGIFDYDVVLIKFDKNGLYTNINEEFAELPAMVIYPNPGQDICNVLSNHNDSNFEIYDITGRCHLKTSLSNGTNSIDTGELPSGTYIFVITIDQKPISSGKWIKR